VGTENVFDQRSFPGTVGTDQAKDSATRDLERHFVQRLFAPETAAKVLDL
jgi:hypothetical protein